uniref:Uncharacterized protein n=1 Tax=Zooxanthella nutricula TaxID=1333877 RepID=A0A7S2JTL2_9DINO
MLSPISLRSVARYLANSVAITLALLPTASPTTFIISLTADRIMLSTSSVVTTLSDVTLGTNSCAFGSRSFWYSKVSTWPNDTRLCLARLPRLCTLSDRERPAGSP